MAILKIYNDIVGEEDKVMLQMWEGIDGICFKDIDGFLASMKPDDDEVDIRIHCRGGDCVEGWAIYDKLRQSGKTISCTVEGECSSMATIILLAAPAERRHATDNSHFCIHNPAAAWPDLGCHDRFTADAIDAGIKKLGLQVEQLRNEQKKILSLYVERTGADETELQELMDKDIFINADRALELGFISEVLAPITAKRIRTFNNTKTTRKMNKKKAKVSVERGVISRLLAKAGYKKLSDVKMNALAVTAADGTELTIEREEGEPQIGDAASPDGEFVMEDGSTIIIAEGVVTDIIPADDDVTAEGLDEDEMVEKIEELQTENETLTEEVDTLTQEKEELEAQLEALKGARVLSSNEKVILAKVNRAGGLAWLNKVCASSSKESPAGRGFRENRNGGAAQETPVQKALREKKEALAKKRNK